MARTRDLELAELIKRTKQAELELALGDRSDFFKHLCAVIKDKETPPHFDPIKKALRTRRGRYKDLLNYLYNQLFIYDPTLIFGTVDEMRASFQALEETLVCFEGNDFAGFDPTFKMTGHLSDVDFYFHQVSPFTAESVQRRVTSERIQLMPLLDESTQRRITSDRIQSIEGYIRFRYPGIKDVDVAYDLCMKLIEQRKSEGSGRVCELYLEVIRKFVTFTHKLPKNPSEKALLIGGIMDCIKDDGFKQVFLAGKADELINKIVILKRLNLCTTQNLTSFSEYRLNELLGIIPESVIDQKALDIMIECDKSEDYSDKRYQPLYDYFGKKLLSRFVEICKFDGVLVHDAFVRRRPKVVWVYFRRLIEAGVNPATVAPGRGDVLQIVHDTDRERLYDSLYFSYAPQLRLYTEFFKLIPILLDKGCNPNPKLLAYGDMLKSGVSRNLLVETIQFFRIIIDGLPTTSEWAPRSNEYATTAFANIEALLNHGAHLGVRTQLEKLTPELRLKTLVPLACLNAKVLTDGDINELINAKEAVLKIIESYPLDLAIKCLSTIEDGNSTLTRIMNTASEVEKSATFGHIWASITGTMVSKCVASLKQLREQTAMHRESKRL